MKKILIIHSNMEIGGAEISLLGLLDSIDYNAYSVDLFLLEHKGEFLGMIPEQVTLLPEKIEYKALVTSVVSCLKKRQYGIALIRTLCKLVFSIENRKNKYPDGGYVLKQYYHANALPLLPPIEGSYDMAISFIDPHFVLSDKVNAGVKVGWFHTDFSRIVPNRKLEQKMWNGCDYAVNVSDQCKDVFDMAHPDMVNRSLMIENIKSARLINGNASVFSAEPEITSDGSIRLLSVGRFSEPKNFDNVPDICRRLREMGLNVKWYLIGFGGDEALIRQKIVEAEMQDFVIVLGKKENPYPYIAACDLYVQPSRYEGKCVAVIEAQILHKPVVITDYATSGSQLQDGYDGVIVPMDNVGCAEGIAGVLRDPQLQEQLIENTKQQDYTNAAEIQKLYQLIEG